MAGVLPERPGPFVAVVVNNGGGNKLDYYLRRDVSYQQIGCDSAQRHTRVTVTFTSDAPTSGLPPYVTTRADAASRETRPSVGTNRSLVNLYTAEGARLLGATLDGRELVMNLGTERGHPVFATQLEIAPGQRHVLVVNLAEPRTPVPSAGPGLVWIQPAVRSAKVDADVPECPVAGG